MPIIYHLVQQKLWEDALAKNQAYQPPTYEQDGFIHLSSDASFLIDIGNNFYKSVKGDYQLLCIDTDLLPAGELKFEAAAPVGHMPAHSTGQSSPLFPHLYGLLLASYVIKVCAVTRGVDGEFVSIEGI